MLKYLKYITIFLLFFESVFADSDSLIRKYVENLILSSKNIIEAKNSDPKNMKKQLENLLRSNLDIKGVQNIILGKRCQTMKSDELKRFTSAYSNYLVSKYASLVIDQYNEKVIKIKKITKSGDKIHTVKAIFVGEIDEIPFEYIISETEQGPQIRDIIVSGVSFLIMQREEFNSIVQNKGIEELIRYLEIN